MHHIEHDAERIQSALLSKERESLGHRVLNRFMPVALVAVILALWLGVL